jgi:prefoldin subunit 5
MQVDVGSGVMMAAEAHSPLKLLVDVGLGFRAECDIAEAQQVARLQEVAAQVSRYHSPALNQLQSFRTSQVSPCSHLRFAHYKALIAL